VPEASDRPQDAGRKHTRRGIPSAATLELLERYRNALRAELSETIAELRPEGARGKPALASRLKLWDLALKLARELGSGSDVTAPPSQVAAPSDATRGRAPRLTRRDRARIE